MLCSKQAVDPGARKSGGHRHHSTLTHVKEALVTRAKPDFAVGGFGHGNHGRIGFGEAMRGHAGCPAKTTGKLVGGDLCCARSRVWRFGRRGEQFEFSGAVGERAIRERCKKHGAVSSFEKRSDSELREFTAEFELSFVVAQDFGALKKDPQVALRVRSEGLNRADGKCGRRRLGKIEEAEAVEANQSFFRADPQVAVRRLRERGYGASGKTFLAAPMLPHVLRQNSIRIECLSQGSATQQRQSSHPALAEPAP